jgi:Domain of unknown function (DUF1844)
MDDTEPKDGFKVSDKRRFTTDGAAGSEAEEPAKPDADDEVAKTSEQPEAAEKPEPEQKSEPEQIGEQEKEELPPINFSSFVMSLANTALFQLGFLKMPDSEDSPKDLLGARQTIDIMAMLQEKTEGNLSDEEKNLLTETLFQLRMAFVEAAK